MRWRGEHEKDIEKEIKKGRSKRTLRRRSRWGE